MASSTRYTLQISGVFIFILSMQIFRIGRERIDFWVSETCRAPEGLMLVSLLSLVVVLGSMGLFLTKYYNVFMLKFPMAFNFNTFLIYSLPGFIPLFIPYTLPFTRSIFLYNLMQSMGWGFGISGVFIGIGISKALIVHENNF